MTAPQSWKNTVILIALMAATEFGWCSHARAGILGDMNGDNVVDGLDVAPFVQAILDPVAFTAEHPGRIHDGDLNADALTEIDDVSQFVERLMNPQGKPEATTGHAVFYNYSVTISLRGYYALYPESSYRITITELPETGQLIHLGATPQAITTVPYTLASNLVRYDYYYSNYASPVAHFSYTVTSTEDNAVSEPRTVTMSRVVGPTASLLVPPLFEDTPAILQLVVSNTEVLPQGDAINYSITLPVSYVLGNMYQIEEDGQTFGAQITSPQPLTNSNGLFGIAPGGNFWGNSINFQWRVKDEIGLYEYEEFSTVNFQCVNDPPVAFSGTAQAPHLLSQFQLTNTISYSDLDLPYGCNGYNSLSLMFQTLPAKGQIYMGSIAPENLVAATNTPYPITLIPNSQFPIWYVRTEPGIGTPFDTFNYSAFDGELESNSATFNINIIQANLWPIVDPVPPITVDEDSDWTYITLSAEDPDGGPEPIHWFLETPPTHGQLEGRNIIDNAWVPLFLPNMHMYPIGSEITLRYKPNPGVNTLGASPDVFIAKATDFGPNGYGSQNLATVSIAIRAKNDAPVITGPTFANARIVILTGEHISAFVTTLSTADDSGNQLIEMSISATNANLLLLSDNSGLVNFQQTSPTSMTFQGTVDMINAALASGLHYDPQAYGTGYINISVNDLGNTGEEDPPLILTAEHQIVVVTTF